MKKYATYIKVGREFIESTNHSQLIKLGKFHNGNRTLYYKGYIIRPIRSKDIHIGQDSDDFVRNLVTVVIDQRFYRAPRILKRVYK